MKTQLQVKVIDLHGEKSAASKDEVYAVVGKAICLRKKHKTPAIFSPALATTCCALIRTRLIPARLSSSLRYPRRM